MAKRALFQSWRAAPAKKLKKATHMIDLVPHVTRSTARDGKVEITRRMIDGGPNPVAPFNHVVTAGDFHFITGQMPTMPDDNTKCVEGGIVEQTHRVMANLKLVLDGIDSGWERVVMVRIYLTNFERDYAAMNEIYKSYFAPGTLPARTTIGVTGLAVGALVEIDLVACR